MFRIEALPAARGDCLWIEYGASVKPRRILIDGGVPETAHLLRARIAALPKSKRCFELLLVTHIDYDHIGGIADLLREPPPGLKFQDIWFNSWQHLGRNRTLSARGAEALSFLIDRRGYPWNSAFEGQAIVREERGPARTITLKGGFDMTVLTPTQTRLTALRRQWEKEVVALGLTPGSAGRRLEQRRLRRTLGIPPSLGSLTTKKFKEDESVSNGSSIGVVAKYGDTSCLLAGDALPCDLKAGIDLSFRCPGRLPLDLFKVSHHGGQRNTSPELLQRISCRRFLFSTDGSCHDHPHLETIARIIKHADKAHLPEFYFNYNPRFLKSAYQFLKTKSFRTHFPKKNGTVIEF